MSKINLTKYDHKFCKTIKDYKKIHLDQSEGVFYTIMHNDKKCGVIGFTMKNTTNYFLKIGIHQDFRGLDIFKKSLTLFARKHKIKKIYSTVARANIPSVKAHKKIGFRRIPLRIENRLKAEGSLLKRNIRLVKSIK